MACDAHEVPRLRLILPVYVRSTSSVVGRVLHRGLMKELRIESWSYLLLIVVKSSFIVTLACGSPIVRLLFLVFSEVSRRFSLL